MTHTIREKTRLLAPRLRHASGQVEADERALEILKRAAEQIVSDRPGARLWPRSDGRKIVKGSRSDTASSRTNKHPQALNRRRRSNSLRMCAPVEMRTAMSDTNGGAAITSGFMCFLRTGERRTLVWAVIYDHVEIA